MNEIRLTLPGSIRSKKNSKQPCPIPSKGRKKIDLTGQRFGRLMVLWDTGERSNGNVVWRCLCDCGRMANINSAYLRGGETRSCGCLAKEMSRARKPSLQKVSDEKIISEYERLGNIWKVGESVGMCGQSVHERIVKLGIKRNLDHITDEEIRIVKNYYKNTHHDHFNREDLLKLLSPEATISRLEHIVTKAGVGQKHRKQSMSARQKQSARLKGKKVPHNGFSGRKHSRQSKANISKSLIKKWQDPGFLKTLDKEGMAKRARENGRKVLNSPNAYSRCKRGYYFIPGRGKMFFRSLWEANYALYLNHLLEIGMIKKWDYESRRFEFPVKRGCVVYTPDFEVLTNSGNIEWHEVKGWMDKKSKTKIKRMAKYYSEEKLIIIGEKRYKELKKSAALFGWFK